MRSQFPRFSPEWWEWMTMPEPNTGCLLWLGHVCSRGYGRIGYGTNKSPVLVHRLAYERVHGDVGRRHVLHRCDTPSCVNPDHLFVGTQADNMRDMFAKGRGNPGGLKTRRLELVRNLAPAAAVKPFELPDSDASVRIGDPIHPIRSGAEVSGWRHVRNIPPKRPTYAIVLANRPQLWTPEPSNGTDERLPSVPTVAPSCGVAR